MFSRYHREKKSWRWFAGIIIGFIFLVGILYARMVQVRKEATESFRSELPPAVKTLKPVPRDTWRYISILARVESAQILTIRADVSGWVQEHPVKRGERVVKNQAVLILRDERKQLALEEATARLEAAKATLADLKRRLTHTQKLYQEGIVSQDMFDSLRHQVDAQEANVKALEATVDRIRWDVDHLVIRSPIDGYVVEIIPDIGQEVMPGEPVARLVGEQVQRVVAGVNSEIARLIKPGMDVWLIRPRNGKPVRKKARIIGVSPAIDPLSGTYKIEAQVLDKEGTWLSGETVYLQIPAERLQNVVIVPRTAVLSDSNGTFIYVFRDNKAIQVPVSVIWINDSEGAIEARLLPSDSEIIIEGMVGLADGQPVRVTERIEFPKNHGD